MLPVGVCSPPLGHPLPWPGPAGGATTASAQPRGDRPRALLLPASRKGVQGIQGLPLCLRPGEGSTSGFPVGSDTVPKSQDKSPFLQLASRQARPTWAAGATVALVSLREATLPLHTSVLPQCKGLCWPWAAFGAQHAVPVPSRKVLALNNSVPVKKNSTPPSSSEGSPPLLPCLAPAQHYPTVQAPLGAKVAHGASRGPGPGQAEAGPAASVFRGRSCCVHV